MEIEEGKGCYKWIIAICGHVIQILTIGSMTSMGVFFIEFMEYFNTDAGTTAWVNSVAFAMLYCVGPVASALNDRFGARPIIIFGGILSSVGTIISTFATNLHTLYISYGVLTGTGVGLAYGPSIIIIGHYFQKHHAIANSIAFAGHAVAYIALGPFYQILIYEYGWRGALLIIAGINMNVIICGLLMKPPTKDLKMKQVQVDVHSQLTDTKDIHMHDIGTCTGNSDYDLSEIIAREEDEETGQTLQDIQDEESNTAEDSPDPDTADANTCEEHTIPSKTKHTSKVANFMFGELAKLKLLCHNSFFRMICVSMFFVGFAYYLAIIHLVAKVVSIGVPKLQASFLLTCFGIGSLTGRSVNGFIIDLAHMPPVPVFVGHVLLAGLMLTLTTVTKLFAVFAVLTAVFGFSVGMYWPSVTVCLKQYLGTQYLSTALGWILFTVGLSSMIGPPVGGWIYDVSSNYNLSILAGGGSLLLAGTIVLIHFLVCKCLGKDIRLQEAQ
ncbi:monocarboxylate transporter 13-like [Glandiceps talaboti]